MHASWHNAPDFLRKNRSSGSGASRHGADIRRQRQTTEEPAETVGGSEESTEAAGTAQAAAEASGSTESSEYAERKSIIITATNECGIDIGMFSVIDPISGEQYNISAIADGQSVSMPVEWPVEITDFQWALYNQNGELCVEATTDISQAESGVTLLLTGDGNLDGCTGDL